MQLTTAQLQAIKADIAASGDLNGFPNNSDGNFAIAALYNQTASPVYWVWRRVVTQAEVMLNGFDWTRVDNLSVGKARIWDWMFFTGQFDPSKANIRAGVIAVWVGTQADLNVRAAVWLHCQREATRIERLLASGAGTQAAIDGTGPGTMGSEGPITYQDVEAARNLP